MRIITVLFIALISANGIGQEKSYGALELSAGTLLFHNQVSLGYETPTLFRIGEKHQFRASLHAGLWNLNVSNAIQGTQVHGNVTYLFGAGDHHLEGNVGGTAYFIRGLKEQPFAYLHRLSRGFLGYRYESNERPLYFRAGIGWYEAIQIGIGWRIKN